jgi:hypothetical protein
MGIALVPHVPDKFVHRRIEDIMDGSRQFDHAKPGAKMATGDGYGRNGFGTQFVRKLAELFGTELPEVRRKGDLIEERRIWAITHGRASRPPIRSCRIDVSID